MFVSCDHCHTEYELDESKIPAGGARLRCTSCDHYFVIAPPEASDLQSSDDLAREAFSTEVSGEADPEPEREAAADEDFDPDGESDWEFNDVETPEFEVDGRESESGFDLEDGSDSGFDLEGAPESELDLDSAFDRDGEWGELSSAEDVVDDLLGSGGVIDADPAAAVDDLLGEVDGGDLRPGDSAGDPTAGSALPSDALHLGDADVVDKSGADQVADRSDILDDLADWDALDPQAETGASASPAGTKRPLASAARDGAPSEPRVELSVAMADASATKVRWTDRLSEIAGWGAVSLLMVVALVGGLASNSSDARVAGGSWSGAGFEADQIAGRWVDNAVGGSIYVVSGRIRRAPGSDRVARKTLGIGLIDATGREIDRAPIPLTPAVPEHFLREAGPAEIDDFQAYRARWINGVGANWTAFEAVLTDLPRFASRFELQARDR